MPGRSLIIALAAIAATACDRVFELDEVHAGPGDGAADAGDVDAVVGTVCFADNFDDDMIAPGLWATSQTAPATVAESGGQLVFTLGIAANPAYAGVSAGARDLTNDAVEVEVVAFPSPATRAEAGFGVGTPAQGYLVVITEGILLTRTTINGVDDDQYLGYNPTAHRFLRLVHTGDGVSFETSPTGEVWVSVRTEPIPFAVTNMSFGLFAGTYELAGSDPGGATFDNLTVRCRP